MRSTTCRSCASKSAPRFVSPIPTPASASALKEGVGEIVEVGAKVRTYKVGDRLLNPGGRLEPGTPFTSMWAK
jgi:threonine dehydrogenase-like Zn-dependent dehydrogenase